MAPSVARALAAIKRYAVAPEQIDHAVLSAINVTLFLASDGDDRVSDGFNRDIAGNGRDLGRWVMEPARFSAALASPQNSLS
jgi:hypothetical protein